MRLELHVPGLREMDARAKWLADPATMAYNRGQAIDAEGYDPETGCIDFPMGDWRYWRGIWLYQEPDRFSAYLLDRETGAFVGEVCYYYDMETDAHGTGVLSGAFPPGKGLRHRGAQAPCRPRAEPSRGGKAVRSSCPPTGTTRCACISPRAFRRRAAGTGVLRLEMEK